MIFLQNYLAYVGKLEAFLHGREATSAEMFFPISWTQILLWKVLAGRIGGGLLSFCFINL